MATNTQVNQNVLSPEQAALAQAELAQMQKRMGFEDFMAEILLGGVPKKATTPGVTAGGAPANLGGGAQLPGVMGNNSTGPGNSSIASGVSSLGNLVNPPAPNPGSGSGMNTLMNGVSSLGGTLLNAATNPANIGAVVGTMSGVPGGGTVGRLLGSGIGNLINPAGDKPTAEEVKNSVSLPPPTKVTSVTAPYDASPNGPTGAQTAARAQQTAQDFGNFQAQTQSARNDMLGVMLNGGAGLVQGTPYANARQTMSNGFDRAIGPKLKAQGYTTEEISKIHDYFIYNNGVLPEGVVIT